MCRRANVSIENLDTSRTLLKTYIASHITVTLNRRAKNFNGVEHGSNGAPEYLYKCVSKFYDWMSYILQLPLLKQYTDTLDLAETTSTPQHPIFHILSGGSFHGFYMPQCLHNT